MKDHSPINYFDFKEFSFVLEIGLALSFFLITAHLLFGVNTLFNEKYAEYTHVLEDHIYELSSAAAQLDVVEVFAKPVTTPSHTTPLTKQSPATSTPTTKISEYSNQKNTRTIKNISIAEAATKTDKLIGVDLEKMQLHLYKNGERIKTVKVLSKGTPGSRFETPSGQYTVKYKNTKHFSSIGGVYMPYSMQFYGNFFIHGWPYYPGGTPVAEGYSGGCIRLSTADAKTVYEFGQTGTQVVVTNSPESPPHNEMVLANLPVPPVSAKAYLVADLDTGQVLAERNARTPYPIASITKLMTAIVANENIAYNEKITVTPTSLATYGESGGLVEGEQLLLETLYYPLLLNSSNDAAQAIAEHRGTGYFMNQMNRKAQALGMTRTHFADPSGLSAGNISTAVDLFRLAHYVYDKKEFIFETTTTLQKNTPWEHDDSLRTFTNNNPLRTHPQFIGGKNGYTDEARHTLLSLFNIPISGKDHTIIVIVLQSQDNDGDTLKLLSWLQQAAQASTVTTNE